MEAIKTTDLTKRYKDVTAVDELNLTVMEGELFSLLGVNGAGKTTTIKMLSCLTKPTGGDAALLGHSIVSSSEQVKSIIGVSPQETAVAPNLTVKENLELMCGVHGFSKEKQVKKVAELSEQFTLSDCLKRKAGKLSGGWQRRLSLGRADPGTGCTGSERFMGHHSGYEGQNNDDSDDALHGGSRGSI